MSVDNDCLLRITDKIDYDINYFAPQDSNETMLSEVNSLRATGFDDNIRTTFAADGELNTTKKVGYVKLPHDLEDEIINDSLITHGGQIHHAGIKEQLEGALS